MTVNVDLAVQLLTSNDVPVGHPDLKDTVEALRVKIVDEYLVQEKQYRSGVVTLDD